MRKQLLLAAAPLLLAACAGPAPPESRPLTSTAGPDLDRSLTAAMRRAAAASAAVAGIEIASANETAEVSPPPPSAALPPELRRRISVDWTGPLAPLLDAVAGEIGYRFVETGPGRAQPVMITMHRLDAPAWEILRDAGMAAATEALVITDVPRRTLEMRRPAVDR